MNTPKLRVLAMALGCVVAAMVSGCDASTGQILRTITVDGRARTYLLHLPADYDEAKPAPMVLALHPFAGTGKGMARTSGFDELADEKNFVACYPEGVTFLWNGDPTDEAGKSLLVENADDIAFLSSLIDHLASTLAIDEQRIYVTGASNGGLMAHRVACELAGKVAAVAAVMTTLPEGFADHVPSGGPVPMLIMHGTADPFFPWEGGVVNQGPFRQSTYRSVDDTVAFWTSRNRAATEASEELLPDIAPDDGTRVIRERHEAGTGEAPVILYRIEGGGHTWPGSSPNFLERVAGVGRVSRDIDASRVIWSFLSNYTRTGGDD